MLSVVISGILEADTVIITWQTTNINIKFTFRRTANYTFSSTYPHSYVTSITTYSALVAGMSSHQKQLKNESEEFILKHILTTMNTL